MFYMHVVDANGNIVKKVNRDVKTGELIGYSQDMASIYNYVFSNDHKTSMTNHLHFEYKYRYKEIERAGFKDPQTQKNSKGEFNYYYDNPQLRYPHWNWKEGKIESKKNNCYKSSNKTLASCK
jgi:hypothetical protein